MNILDLKDIRKSFGNVRALAGVNLQLQAGEVHALIGENGAGKSTLMKILSGAYSSDSGTMTFKGQPYQVSNPAMAREAGIAMIYQELTLAPELSIAENICLGIEKSSWGIMKIDRPAIKACLAALGHDHIDLNQPVKELSIGLKQVIEITRALYSQAEVVIMDEPTSSLSAEDTKALFKVIQKLRDQGISIIYISHFLEEVTEVADSFTVLRDGETVATGSISDTSIDQLVEHMVGRSINELFPKLPHKIGKTILEVNSLSGEKFPNQASFELKAGEILGIAGLVGSGRTETLRCLFGLDSITSGNLTVQGQKITSISPAKSLRSGIDLLSENRKEEGLATELSISNNLTLSALNKYTKLGWLNLKQEAIAARKFCGNLNVQYRDISQPVDNLSGGNQQKVALTRLLHHDSNILLLDEPTRGIDIGSKVEIYKLTMELATQGKAIIMVSSYLPELLGICDTLAVMHRGKLSAKKPTNEWTENEIMRYATAGN